MTKLVALLQSSAFFYNIVRAPLRRDVRGRGPAYLLHTIRDLAFQQGDQKIFQKTAQTVAQPIIIHSI
jgi:hypothetical protein